ncbi:MAG: SixA phosphatase family protein [Flavobacteriales bacterium]
MNWYFLRHAKTEREAQTGKDFDRALASKGKQQVTELLPMLSSYPIRKVVCSSAIRTRQTLSGLHSLKGIETIYSDELYLATLDQWECVLKEHAKDHCLFIGHNDGISACLSWLTQEEVYLQTAGFIHVTFTAGDPRFLASGTAVINHRFRP